MLFHNFQNVIQAKQKNARNISAPGQNQTYQKQKRNLCSGQAVLCFNCLERLIQIVGDVVDVFRTDRQADGAGMDALLLKLFLVELRMSGGSGMDNQALYVRNVRQKREYLKMVDKLLGSLCAALDVEGEDRTGAVREVTVVQLFIAAFGERGMVDALDQRMVLKVIDDLQRVLYMAFNT